MLGPSLKGQAARQSGALMAFDSTAARVAANTLLWAGKRLTNWGNQLEREYRKPAYN